MSGLPTFNIQRHPVSTDISYVPPGLPFPQTGQQNTASQKHEHELSIQLAAGTLAFPNATQRGPGRGNGSKRPEYHCILKRHPLWACLWALHSLFLPLLFPSFTYWDHKSFKAEALPVLALAVGVGVHCSKDPHTCMYAYP